MQRSQRDRRCSVAFLYSVLYIAGLGIAAHFVGQSLPAPLLRYDRFPCRLYAWEKNGKIYNKLRIRAWKDRLPDMSRITKDMVPKRVGDSPTSEHLWVLVRETCRAELTHIGLCVLSPVIWFFWQNWVGILLSAIAILCNLPFILIQRYNRPAFVSLAKRLEAREERKRNANTHSFGKHGRRA